MKWMVIIGICSDVEAAGLRYCGCNCHLLSHFDSVTLGNNNFGQCDSVPYEKEFRLPNLSISANTQ